VNQGNIRSNNYAFIDGQNLDKGIKGQGWILDYQKFRDFLVDRFSITKVFYFVGYMERYLNVYNELRKNGYTLCFRKPLTDHNGDVKANVDSNLITHVMIKINNYDQAVIVAGDSDYYCLCKFLIRHNKLCQVLMPSKSKCPGIYKQNLKFRNLISYLSTQVDILAK
jgi:uncharacterized LabA/DUF88 family protein